MGEDIGAGTRDVTELGVDGALERGLDLLLVGTRTRGNLVKFTGEIRARSR